MEVEGVQPHPDRLPPSIRVDGKGEKRRMMDVGAWSPLWEWGMGEGRAMWLPSASSTALKWCRGSQQKLTCYRVILGDFGEQKFIDDFVKRNEGIGKKFARKAYNNEKLFFYLRTKLVWKETAKQDRQAKRDDKIAVGILLSTKLQIGCAFFPFPIDSA